MHGRHLFKRCRNLQPAALPRPVPANARTEYSLRGRQRQPILSADLLFPGDRPSVRAFVAENGGWVVSGNEDVFNCQLPVHHFNAVVDHLQTLPNIEIIACGKRSAYALNRYNDALKTGGGEYYHRLELVDDFNHFDDTILKFGLKRARQPDPGNSAEAARGAGGHGHRGGHRLRQHRLIIPGVHKANGLRICSSAGALRITRWWRSATAAAISKCCSTPGLASPWQTPGKTSKPSPAVRRRDQQRRRCPADY